MYACVKCKYAYKCSTKLYELIQTIRLGYLNVNMSLILRSKDYGWSNPGSCSSMGGVQLPWALGGAVGGVGSVGGVAAMSQPPQVLHYPAVQHFQVQPVSGLVWV